jgi:glyoxylase-like metal-dependent hydrolase (beta-lactamase superfamily II)
MRRIVPGVYLENIYIGTCLGNIVTNGGLFLIDAPARIEDWRDWRTMLGDYGEPRYLALLDSHQDRALGARNTDLPRVAHDWTLQTMSNWSDTFKGGARPIGAETDDLKRIAGVRKAVPECTFSDQMIIHLGERDIHLWHRPGPTPGSIWVVLPKEKVAFIGDTVTVAEPPYIGKADIDAWLNTLEDLRGLSTSSYKLVSSRDGVIKHKDINAMARFLRKISLRLERLGKEGEPLEMASKFARNLMKSYKISSARRGRVLLRLQVGFTRLYNRLYPSET